MVAATAVGGVLLSSPLLRADQYHYKNVLIGERAAGLGGAFVAISDDPSGIYYNPAGLVFSIENYFSLSANAFSNTSQTFKDIAPGQDYTYTSQALVPAFFGFTQSYGKHKFGFAVIVPDSEFIDQDNTLVNSAATGTGVANTLKRRFFQQDITYLFGPAYAREIVPGFTIGVSFFGFYRTNKWIDNQLILYNPVGAGAYFVQDSFLTQTTFGCTPKLGIQYMATPKLAVGLTAQKAINMGGSGTLQSFATQVDSNGVPVVSNGTFEHDATLTRSDKVSHSIPDPLSLSAGGAYFFDRATLLTAQLDFYGPVSDFKNFSVSATTNWAVGFERYLSETWALRAGAFSNNANTPNVDEGGLNQAVHVNLIGGSVGASLNRPGTSLSISTAYSAGSGQGQGLSDNTRVQTVKQSNLTVFLTGSYQL
jgi:long-chain fatty acid transport protein